ncbi:MAG TPA: AEC family transporter, partial [Clostridia bacterium]|nr:AEC family transporter [Clostridia bacterium]
MTEILGKVLPLLFLIALGYVLQHMQYFGEEAFFKLQSLVLNIALPCMLCTTFINLDVDVSYAWLSVAFFSLMII